MALTIAEIAQAEGVGVQQVIAWLHEGLPHQQGPMGLVLVTESDLECWLDQYDDEDE